MPETQPPMPPVPANGTLIQWKRWAVGVVTVAMMGGVTLGGMTMHEWAEAAKSLPVLVEEIRALRTQLKESTLVVEDALGVEEKERREVIEKAAAAEAREEPDT